MELKGVKSQMFLLIIELVLSALTPQRPKGAITSFDSFDSQKIN